MLKEDCLRESEQAKRQISELEIKSRDCLTAANTTDFRSMVEKLNGMAEVTASMLSLVERISVFDGNRIEIKFSFEDEFERICSSLEN